MVRRYLVLSLGIFSLSVGNAAAQGTAFEALVPLITTATGNFGGNAPDATTTIVLLNTFAAEITTFPLGSSSSGFTWSFDPSLGVQTRRSNSFGSVFAERPLTNGKKKLNVAVAYQHTTFHSIAGQSLDTLVSTYPVISPTGVPVGSVGAEAQIDLSTDRTTVSASYGITDRVDVGIVIPFGRTKVRGSSQVVGYNLAGEVVVPAVQIANVDTSSSGLGDIIVRGKVALPAPASVALAVGADLRLSTGDAQKLLGIGSTSGAVMVMGAAPYGAIAPHFNLGYKFAGSGGFFETPDEVNYIFGVDVAATPAVTIIGDVIGRSLLDSATVGYESRNGLAVFTSSPGTQTLLLGTVGTKIRISGMWLLTASVLFPLNDSGVKPRPTPVIGFERAF